MLIISPIVKIILKITSLVFFALTVLCCFGGYFPPQIFTLPSVLVLAAPYMLTASALIIVVWFCLKSWIIASVGVITLIICSTPLRMNFPFSHPKEANPGATTFKLLTWNVAHGMDFSGADSTERRTFRRILAEKADIVCLQELRHYDEPKIYQDQKELMDSLYALYPYRERFGGYDVAIWSKYPFTRLAQAEDHYYPNARFARFNINGNPFLLCNVHLTSYNLDDQEQSVISGIKSPEGLENSLKNFKHTVYNKLGAAFNLRAGVTKNLLWNISAYRGPVIVCGDFNDVPGSWTYRLFLSEGFKDAYCATNFWGTTTFNNHFLFFHIDQILYRGRVRPLTVDRIDMKSSDHYGLTATFEFGNEH